MADRFLIAPMNSGLITAVKPFAIPDDSFSRLSNAYVWRDRVRKRFGSSYLIPTVTPTAGAEQLASRLRFKVGTTNNLGELVGGAIIDDPVTPALTFAPGQMVSVGDRMYTITAMGATATFIQTATGTVTLTDATKVLTVTGSATTADVYFYPALPVTGLLTYESGELNDFPTIAFDTRFSYEYLSTGWERIWFTAPDTDDAYTWSGTDADLFWAATWRGAAIADKIFFATNYDTSDGIRHYNGTTWVQDNFVQLPANTIDTARIILPFKNRLVLFSTIENGAEHGNRARCCQNGSPFEANAWREDIVGKGFYIDAPTQERIITANLLRDRCIVYFEASTWEFVYTENPVIPFIWQQLNSELGSQSTFSVVPFDINNFAVGYNGVHSCNGVNVSRIDSKIPDFIFDLSQENQGPFRTYGIRDYSMEMAYWSMPINANKATFADKFPNSVLCYNYITGSWGLNDDSITVFGYFRKPVNATWGNTTLQWSQMDSAWNAPGLTIGFKQVIAGNQEGYTFSIEPRVARNAGVLQITDMVYASNVVTITAINHNLKENDWILLENIVTDASPEIVVTNNYQIDDVTGDNTFTIIDDVGLFNHTYKGGGTITRVSAVNIFTKQFNFYQDKGRQFAINKVDMLVDRTDLGEVTVNYYVGTGIILPQLTEAINTGTFVDTGILDTKPYTSLVYEFTQDQLWHTTYPIAAGNYIQLQIYLSDDQLENIGISTSDFQMHAMCFTAQPTSARFQ